ncbi:hypothetical protein VNO77_05700 [Canavalia gladiata]|uniref:Uncharacterized protein n=1 Tax=Canavalia gladiata TaxID=3824 RepID=A0AAN9MYU8_CANGL
MKELWNCVVPKALVNTCLLTTNDIPLYTLDLNALCHWASTLTNLLDFEYHNLFTLSSLPLSYSKQCPSVEHSKTEEYPFLSCEQNLGSTEWGLILTLVASPPSHTQLCHELLWSSLEVSKSITIYSALMLRSEESNQHVIHIWVGFITISTKLVPLVFVSTQSQYQQASSQWLLPKQVFALLRWKKTNKNRGGRDRKEDKGNN